MTGVKCTVVIQTRSLFIQPTSLKVFAPQTIPFLSLIRFLMKRFKFLGRKNSQNRLGPTFKYHTQLSKTSVQLVSVDVLSFYYETRRE